MSTSSPQPPQLSPTVGDPLDATMELSLLEQLADPVALDPQVPDPTPLGRTYAFDFVAQRLIPGAAGGPLMLYGVEALKGWIRKTLLTDRAAAPVHKINDFGLDGANEIIDGSTFDESAVAELQGRIGDAMRVHPRIADITDFQIDYDDGTTSGNPPDDAAFVSFTVLIAGDDADPLSIERYPLASPVGGDVL